MTGPGRHTSSRLDVWQDHHSQYQKIIEIDPANAARSPDIM
jgi:hypothetical protein